jgi:hypothetical protein
VFFLVTNVNVFSEGSHNGWHTWIEPQGFFDATFQVFELRRVLSGARAIRVTAKHLIHFFHYHLLHAKEL